MTAQDVYLSDAQSHRDGWRTRAACRGMDPSIFFHDQLASPPGAHRSAYVTARAVCAGCEVSAECRDYAQRARENYGVWGGLSVNQRSESLPRGRPAGRRCGTESGYGGGCRCDLCRRAHTDAYRARRARTA